MAVDERKRSPPGIVRRCGESLLLAIEKAVRCTVVRDDLVLDAGVRERPAESGIVIGRDAGIVARLQREDGRLDLRNPFDCTRSAALSRR